MSGASCEVRVEVIDGFGCLPALKPEWEALFTATPHEPSSSFEWTMALARNHVRPDDRCFVVRLLRGGAVVGLVPLIARTARILSWRVVVLTPLSEQYNTHSELMFHSVDDDLMAAFLRALFRLPLTWDFFRVARMLEDAPQRSILQRCLQSGRYTHRIRHGIPAYVLWLPDSFEEYLRSRSAKFRNYLKRNERKLFSHGTIDVHAVNGSHQLERGYEALLRVERGSWKQSHGTAITAVQHQATFYQDLCEGALDASRLHLQWMTIDGAPVAYNLGYLTAGRYHYLKTSYDHTFRAASPATFLRARLIETLIARGIRELDFPGEPYEWERQWTEVFRWRTVVQVYARTARGWGLAQLDRLRHPSPGARALAHLDPRKAHSR